MAGTTIQTYAYTPGTLYLEGHFCGQCGVAFGMEESYVKNLKREKRTFYCPNGHGRVFLGETEEARLKRELKYANDRAAQLAAARDQAEASRRAWKGQATRARKQVLEGACPICGAHVYQLERHVKRQHPNEQVEQAEPTSA